jgi:hypothetical protein
MEIAILDLAALLNFEILTYPANSSRICPSSEYRRPIMDILRLSLDRSHPDKLSFSNRFAFHNKLAWQLQNAKGRRRYFMHELIRDLRQAIRGFRKSPGTTAIIIVALALGIGVNVSSFIIVEGVVLHSPSFPQLDRLMMVWESPAGMAETREGIAPANYLDLKERNQSFQSLGAYCNKVNVYQRAIFSHRIPL